MDGFLRSIFPPEVIAAALAVQVITWIFLKRLNVSKPLPDHVNLMVGIALNAAVTACAGAVALYGATGVINWFNILVYAFAGGLAGVLMQSPTQAAPGPVADLATEQTIIALHTDPEMVEAILAKAQAAQAAKADETMQAGP